MAVLVLVVLATATAAGYAAAWRWAARPASPPRAERPAAQPSTPDVSGIFGRRQQERRRRALSSRPPLPADDVPPPGLTPLVPSPRSMRLEAMRGIRELEDWLAGRASSA